ncbi:MAG: hypothetical protein CMH57_03845 [Myxococcales bacterium]|nr:hypothetical protein [Myxococcales bacterium]
MPDDEQQPQPPETPTEAEATEEDSYQSRIIIKPNGEVVIENLSIDLMELLERLDPDAEIACEVPEEHPARGDGEAEGEPSP